MADRGAQMPISISKSALPSRAVRNAIGLRSFTPSLSQSQGSGNAIQWIVGGAFRLGKFLLSTLFNFASFTLSSLWGLIVQGVNFVWTFNWNASDQDLDRQARAQWNSLGGLLGGLAGNAFGWFACGILPGISIFTFNKAMGLYVLKEVGEEALEELAANVANVTRTIFRNLSRNAFTWAFKNFRRWMKEPGNQFAKALFGDRYDQVMREWGRQGGPSWSFASALEDRIERIPNKFLQQFLEEFLEESWDACVEAGFVVANSVESYLAMQKQSTGSILGPERIIEVMPDREAESEKLILAGPENVLKAQLPGVLANYQMVENRDIGQFVGEPWSDEARRGDLTLRLKIILYNVAAPPWERVRQGGIRRVTVTVPDVERSKLDWEKIRAACGGANGYLWGRFKATARLTNKRTMIVYGGTANEAEERLRTFLSLSDAKIKTIEVTEEMKEGDRLLNPGLYKEATRIYPAYCFVLNRELVIAGDRGKPVGKNRYVDRRGRLDLWTATKPHDWDTVVADVLRRSGSGNNFVP